MIGMVTSVVVLMPMAAPLSEASRHVVRAGSRSSSSPQA
jgi:hypothetical protein